MLNECSPFLCCKVKVKARQVSEIISLSQADVLWWSVDLPPPVNLHHLPPPSTFWNSGPVCLHCILYTPHSVDLADLATDSCNKHTTSPGQAWSPADQIQTPRRVHRVEEVCLESSSLPWAYRKEWPFNQMNSACHLLLQFGLQESASHARCAHKKHAVVDNESSFSQGAQVTIVHGLHWIHAFIVGAHLCMLRDFRGTWCCLAFYWNPRASSKANEAKPELRICKVRTFEFNL